VALEVGLQKSNVPNVSQGSAPTRLRCGGIFNDCCKFFTNWSCCLTVQLSCVYSVHSVTKQFLIRHHLYSRLKSEMNTGWAHPWVVLGWVQLGQIFGITLDLFRNTVISRVQQLYM